MKQTLVAILLILLIKDVQAQKIKMHSTFKSEYCQGGTYLGKIGDEHYFQLRRYKNEDLITNTTVFSEDLKTIKRELKGVYGEQGYLINNQFVFVSQDRKVEKKKNIYTVTYKKFSSDGDLVIEKEIYEEKHQAATYTSKGDLVIDIGFIASPNKKFIGIIATKKFMVIDVEKDEVVKTYNLANFKVLQIEAFRRQSNLFYYLLDNGSLITIQHDKSPLEANHYNLGNDEIKNLKIPLTEKENFSLYSCLNQEKTAILIGNIYSKDSKKSFATTAILNEDAEGCNINKLSLNEFKLVDSRQVLYNEKQKRTDGKKVDLDNLRIVDIHEYNNEYFLVAERYTVYYGDKNNSVRHENFVIAKAGEGNQSQQVAINKKQMSSEEMSSYFNQGYLYLVYNDDSDKKNIFTVTKISSNFKEVKSATDDTYKNYDLIVKPSKVEILNETNYTYLTWYRKKFGFIFIE